MHVQMAFSGQMFSRLIRYRIAERFRPYAEPIEWPAGVRNWIDGFVVTDVRLERATPDRVVDLNRLDASGKLQPVGTGFLSPTLVVDLAATAYLAKVTDVAAAGEAAPPVTPLPVPHDVLSIAVTLDVGADGVPVLSMRLDPAKLGALGLPAPAITAIAGAATSASRLDIAGGLAGLLPPGRARVLNAALTLGPDDAVVMRFELADQAEPSLGSRLAMWTDFAKGDPHAELDGQDWCVSLDGGALAEMMAAAVGPLIKDSHPVYFTGDGVGSWSGGRVTVTKAGRIDNACAGNDVRFTAHLNVDFSVPQENRLRATLSFDYTKNGWDVAKCVGLAIVNPLFTVITLFDQGQPGLALGTLALDLVFPAGPAVVVGGLALLLAGGDDSLVQKLVSDRLDDAPQLTRVGDSFAVDRDVRLNNALTRDWLALTGVTGSGGRLLLRGVSRVPVARLPKLSARDLSGFGPWRLRDRCEPGRGTVSEASVALLRDPGHLDPGEPPVAMPTVPIRYGMRADGSTAMYDVLADPLGIYTDTFANLLSPITLEGIPGMLRAELRSDVIVAPRFAAFRENPYPLRVRMYTNGGVREYEFAAPAPFAPYVETAAQAAARISRCKAISIDPLRRAMVRLRWLVDPEPVGRQQNGLRGRQFWQVHLIGLEPGRRADLLDAGDAALARAYGNADGRGEISLLLPEGTEQTRLFVEAAGAPVTVVMRQASCVPLTSIRLGGPLSGLQLAAAGEHVEVCALDPGGRRVRWTLTEPAIAELASRPGGLELVPMPGVVGRREGAWHVAALDPRTTRPEVAAKYVAIPALIGTSSCGALLARADNEGEVTIYRCEREIVVAGPQWLDAEPAAGAGWD